MKTKMKYIMLLLLLLVGTTAKAQTDKAPKTLEIVIQTSAECEDCKARLENHLNYTKGVVYSNLDLETKKITVKYKTAVLTPEQIKKEISALGYNADEVPADSKAYEALPSCCKAGGMEHQE